MIWNLLKPYFSRKEKWGDSDKIDKSLLMFLYQFRKTFPEGVYMNINCGWEERKTGGGHPDGRAVDVHITGIGFLIIEEKLQGFIKKNNLEKWIALGIYPEWGGGHRPGFHIEVEKEERTKPRRWGAYYLKNTEGAIIKEDGRYKQLYIAYDLALKNAGNSIVS